jgi:hypothetical protein
VVAERFSVRPHLLPDGLVELKDEEEQEEKSAARRKTPDIFVRASARNPGHTVRKGRARILTGTAKSGELKPKACHGGLRRSY